MDKVQEAKEAIEIVKKAALEYKPDGVGGSCQCDACNIDRPIYNAFQTVLSRLTELERELSERNDELAKLVRENEELREYRERLDSVMEDLVMVLPNKSGSPSDDEIIRETIAEIKQLQQGRVGESEIYDALRKSDAWNALYLEVDGAILNEAEKRIAKSLASRLSIPKVVSVEEIDGLLKKSVLTREEMEISRTDTMVISLNKLHALLTGGTGK